MDEIVDILHENLYRYPQKLSYLRRRGLSEQTVREFKLGFCNRDLYMRCPEIAVPEMVTHAGFPLFYSHIMFPIWDRDGKLTGVAGRNCVTDASKYLRSRHSTGSPNYCIHRMPEGPVSQVYIVEGYFDALVLQQRGYYAIATGVNPLTGDTVGHLRQLPGNPQLVLMMDGDEAGHNATVRNLCRFPTLSVIQLPDGWDPDDYLLQHGELPAQVAGYEWMAQHRESDEIIQFLLQMPEDLQLQALCYMREGQ